MSLPWNGTYLGSVDRKKSILFIQKINVHKKFYYLNLNGYMLSCLGFETIDTHYCIADELKILFGLQKLGTHWIRFGQSKKLLILINPTLYQLYPNFTSLTMIDPKAVDETFKFEVQKIFIYRLTLNIINNSDTLIDVINGKPISTKEAHIDNVINNSHISKTIFDKWFNEIDYSKVAIKIFNLQTIEQVTNFINIIRDQIYAIINQVDQTEIYLSNYILGRLYNLLQLGVG